MKPPWALTTWPTPRAPLPTTRSLPGGDPATVARWSKQIWTLADAQVFADSTARKHSLKAAISEARKNHPNVVKMDKSQFKQWVVKTATVSGTPIASSVELKDSTLNLSVDDANLRSPRSASTGSRR